MAMKTLRATAPPALAVAFAASLMLAVARAALAVAALARAATGMLAMACAALAVAALTLAASEILALACAAMTFAAAAFAASWTAACARAVTPAAGVAFAASVTLVWALAAVTERAGRTLGPLERFGRASLFIYWIHVELVYGYTTWVIRHRLPLWGTGLAYLFFCAAMYRAVVLRDRVVSRWRARRGVGPAPQAVTA